MPALGGEHAVADTDQVRELVRVAELVDAVGDRAGRHGQFDVLAGLAGAERTFAVRAARGGESRGGTGS